LIGLNFLYPGVSTSGNDQSEDQTQNYNFIHDKNILEGSLQLSKIDTAVSSKLICEE